ncbi:hypothetical protein QQF64_023924 [Cirrhinus molitorella]|uniref:Uncharacterized protein n=1 Tax=Cirrhinus molitorella TaxID=172907 RepID=A0ABR3NKN4_9TELE
MADIALPPPAPFLALPVEPPIPWNRWLQSFETFILAVGLTGMSAARKKALLLHCLGVEGQRVLGALESGTTSNYDTAVELLTAHFAAPQSVLLQRFLFRQRHQLPGESVQQTDDLSLSRAITIAVRIESAAACASALTKQQIIADCPAPSPSPTISVTAQPG